MDLSTISSLLIILSFLILSGAFLLPPIILFYFYFFDKSQQQHSVLRNYPLLGRLRYIFEQIGLKMRQYFFDSDTVGKPFFRSDYKNIVIAGKYRKPSYHLGKNVILSVQAGISAMQRFRGLMISTGCIQAQMPYK